MSPTCEVEYISPETARSWLALNTDNFRSLDKMRVSRYAREMQRGCWEVNGEAIKFSPEPKLLDGQHRLHAIVESGCTIQSFVARGVNGSPTIDRGKPRTVGQWLQKEGFKNANAAAATARSVLAYRKGLWTSNTWQVDAILDSEIIDFAVQNRTKLVDAITVSKCCVSLIPQSVLGAIVYIGSGDLLPSQNETTSWFCGCLASGLNVTATDPVYHLRNKMVSDKGSKAKLSLFMKRMLATIAWNKTVQGESVRLLRFNATGPSKQSPPSQVFVAEPC